MTEGPPKETPEIPVLRANLGRIFTTKEVAEILRICTDSVQRLARKRKIKHFRVAGDLRFFEKHIEEYIAQRMINVAGDRVPKEKGS